MNTVEMLTEAREKIASGWAKEAMARDRKSRVVEATSPDAAKFCAMGAIYSVAAANALLDRPIYPTCVSLLFRSLPERFQENYSGLQNAVSYFNDTRPNKHQILALYDRAIEMAGA